MSKEFDELKRLAEHDRTTQATRLKERYQYAKSLGFPVFMAMRLQGSSKERILRLSKELKGE